MRSGPQGARLVWLAGGGRQRRDEESEAHRAQGDGPTVRKHGSCLSVASCQGQGQKNARMGSLWTRSCGASHLPPSLVMSALF